MQMEPGCWTLPAKRAKAARAHTFPLVLPLLVEVKRLRPEVGIGYNDPVFRADGVLDVTWRHKRDMMARFVKAAQLEASQCRWV